MAGMIGNRHMERTLNDLGKIIFSVFFLSA